MEETRQVPIQATLPESWAKTVQQEADKQERSLAGQVRFIIGQWIKEKGKK
ncbi:hypothetical protein N9937_00665 [bacterium]|nr:hypothetical protein [bacterium]